MYFLSKEEMNYLKKQVEKSMNILIIGGTGSGKTTVLNTLLDLISEDVFVGVVQNLPIIKSNRNNFLSFEYRYDEFGNIINFLLQQERPDCLIIDDLMDNSFYELLHGIRYKNKNILMSMYGTDISKSLNNFYIQVENYNKYFESEVEIKSLLGKKLDLIIHIERMNNGNRKLKLIEVVGYNEFTHKIELKEINLID